MFIVWRDKDDPKVYEQARTRGLFNVLIPQRYPLAIASVKSENDIVDAVKLAIENKCRISIRAGGHSFASWSLRDNALLIDLHDYQEISFDEDSGIVRVSPSTTGQDLHNYVSARGRMVSVGHCPSVGLGGFLLSGGMGWNCNSWGWACEQVGAIDVVTAAGQLITADAQNHPGLFWAARGGGPAFPAIVTRFHLQTRPAPAVLRSSGYVFAARNCRAAIEWAMLLAPFVGMLNPNATLELSAHGSYQEGIDEPCLTVTLLASGDNPEATERLLAYAKESHPPKTISYWFNKKTSLQEQLDNLAKAYPENHRYCVDNLFFKNETYVPTIVEKAFTTLPSRKSLVLWQSMIPCSGRELPDMALSIQSDHYLALYSIWEHEEDDSRCNSWVRRVIEEADRDSVGSYVGEFDFQARGSRCWGQDQRRRLVGIRRKWDPSGRICGCLGLADMD